MIRYPLLAAAAIVSLVSLAGCGGGQFPMVGTDTSTRTSSDAPDGHNDSWTLPEAKDDDLLYVDAGDGKFTYVLSYPKGKTVGEIRRHQSDMQQGLCSDGKGDVFVNAMNGNYGNTYEYAHAGKKPLQDLVEPYVWVYGCSVDPTTGDLAVASVNWLSAASYVAIYAHAAGAPQLYEISTIINYEFCGYDDNGNLFVDGTGRSGSFAFAELPKGGAALKNVSLDQSIEWGGQVQWDGRHIVVGAADASPAVAYQFSIKGNKGVETGSTTLGGSVAVQQFWIAGKMLIGPEASANEIGIWKYPGGGAPIATIVGVRNPFGATISLAVARSRRGPTPAL